MPKIARPGACDNIHNVAAIHPRLKSDKIALAHNISLCQQILLEFCTEHGSITVMLSAKFLKAMLNKNEIMDKWDFVRFQIMDRLSTLLQAAGIMDHTTPMALFPLWLSAVISITTHPRCLWLRFLVAYIKILNPWDAEFILGDLEIFCAAYHFSAPRWQS